MSSQAAQPQANPASGSTTGTTKQLDEIKPKELSRDLIKTLLSRDDKGIKLSGCLQILTVAPDSSQIEVSDGYSKSHVVLLRNIRPVLQQYKITPYDVVYITLVLHKGEKQKQMIVAVEITKIYGGVNCLIGCPVEYEAYYKDDYINHRGDGSIPKFCWQIYEIKKAQVGAFHRDGIGHKEFDDSDAAQHAIINIKSIKKNGGLVNLRVRVTKKTPKKDYSSKTVAKGKLFSCILRDSTGEIQATFFQDATEKFFDTIVDETMYIFKGCEVRNRGSYNPTDNPLELYVPAKCTIEPTLDDPRISRTIFEFVRINELQTRPPKSNCDMVGVVTSVTAPDLVARRTGDALLKQAVKLKDDSGFEADINLWGEIPNSGLLKVGSTVCILDLSVSDFKDRMLNSKTSTRLIAYLPEHPRVIAVRDWKKKCYEIKPGSPGGNEDRRGPIATYLLTVDHYRRAVNKLVANGFEGKRFFSIRAFTSTFSANYFYEKCPNTLCYKKTSFDEKRPGVTLCPTCGPLHRPPATTFIGNLRITDHTGSIYVNYATEHIGHALYGMSVQELKQMQTRSQEEFEMYVRSRMGVQYIFRLFFKKDIVEGEIKLKYHLASVFEETSASKIRYTNLSLRASLKLLLRNIEKDAELEELNQEMETNRDQATDQLLSKLMAEYSEKPSKIDSETGSGEETSKPNSSSQFHSSNSDPSQIAAEINQEHQMTHEDSALIEMISTNLTVEPPTTVRVSDFEKKEPESQKAVPEVSQSAPGVETTPAPTEAEPSKEAAPTEVGKSEGKAGEVIATEVTQAEVASESQAHSSGEVKEPVATGVVELVTAGEAETKEETETRTVAVAVEVCSPEKKAKKDELPLGLKSPGADSQLTKETDSEN